MISIIREKCGKVSRVLTIHSKLVQGEIINKQEMTELFDVNNKTIQRDIEDIRAYFAENIERLGFKDITYKRHKNGYILENRGDGLTKEDILSILKILFESRAFCIEELEHLTQSLLAQVGISQKKHIKDIAGNELLNYVPLTHNDFLLSKIWDLSELISNKQITQIRYTKTNGDKVKRVVKPVAVIFSEYYFYLAAYCDEFDSPTIFRIDRIKSYKMIGQKFYIANKERFEDGEFRKRVQFMYPGKLMKIKFEFTGSSLDAVLDRLPTARVIEAYNGKYLIEAEVYGRGIIMWILSQGEYIKVISPKSLVDEIVVRLDKMCGNYR